MDRGEKLYAQNWVEQWKTNVRELGGAFQGGRDEPTVNRARHFWCQMFTWASTMQGHDVWRDRMYGEWPSWASSHRLADDLADPQI